MPADAVAYVLEIYADGAVEVEVEVADPNSGSTLALVVVHRDELTRDR
jgi:hypothetical protein